MRDNHDQAAARLLFTVWIVVRRSTGIVRDRSAARRPEQATERRIGKIELAYHERGRSAYKRRRLPENRCRRRDRGDLVRARIEDFFVRQLHVAILVAGIVIVAPVMHRQEISQVNGRILPLVFEEMRKQRRQLQRFTERAVQEENRNQQEDTHLFHAANIRLFPRPTGILRLIFISLTGRNNCYTTGNPVLYNAKTNARDFRGRISKFKYMG